MTQKTKETVRIYRILCYTGPKEIVEAHLKNVGIKRKSTFGELTIRTQFLPGLEDTTVEKVEEEENPATTFKRTYGEEK